MFVIDLKTDSGLLVECFNSLDQTSQALLLGYALGLKKMQDEQNKEKKESLESG